MNFDKARHHMVAQQVRSWDVINKAILDAMLVIQREEFVQVSQRKLAFADLTLPIGNGQSMMKPVIEGRMLQALDLEPNHLVLEVGTGSAYVTALLGHMSAHVHSIDIEAAFVEAAKQKLKESQIDNVTLENDNFFTFKPVQTYDRVVITGSLPALPDRVFDWLKPNGKVFAIIGDDPIMEARVYHDAATHQSHFDTVVAPLIDANSTQTFEL